MKYFSNARQRVRVWLVAIARTNIVKEHEPEENPQDFPSIHKLAIDYTRCCALAISFFIILFNFIPRFLSPMKVNKIGR
jgi:hypothetical protein